MNNNFFTLCESSDNKVETYNCCLNTCLQSSTEPKLCYPMCAQIFPIIKEKCAFEFNCWNEGKYDNFCLKQNSKNIQDCCIDKCKKLSFNKYPDFIDCDVYCSDYSLL